MQHVRITKFDWPRYLAVIAISGIVLILALFITIPGARSSLLLLAAAYTSGATLLFAGQRLYARFHPPKVADIGPSAEELYHQRRSMLILGVLYLIAVAMLLGMLILDKMAKVDRAAPTQAAPPSIST